ncbi:hypothetical protein E2C01_089185 [Portunus trituberculatus]|uniref:Uncharacterized protein n=1 Tax=Portunus trituberculatus TaxID=210409 RepID=A0A5B7JNW2_PORTR|nr:hypothetical protein [Portunus trituberculatus]
MPGLSLKGDGHSAYPQASCSLPTTDSKSGLSVWVAAPAPSSGSAARPAAARAFLPPLRSSAPSVTPGAHTLPLLHLRPRKLQTLEPSCLRHTALSRHTVPGSPQSLSVAFPSCT